MQVKAATFETQWQSSSPVHSSRQPALRKRKVWQLRSSKRLLVPHICSVPEQAVRACSAAFSALQLGYKHATFIACGTPRAGVMPGSGTCGSCALALWLDKQCSHAGQEGLSRQHADVSAAAVAGLLKTAVLEDPGLQWRNAGAAASAARQPLHSTLAADVFGEGGGSHGVHHTPRCSPTIFSDCPRHGRRLTCLGFPAAGWCQARAQPGTMHQRAGRNSPW